MGQANLPRSRLGLLGLSLQSRGILAGASEGVLYGSGLPLVTAALDCFGPVLNSGSKGWMRSDCRFWVVACEDPLRLPCGSVCMEDPYSRLVQPVRFAYPILSPGFA
jgi:hypothetical protein